MTFKFSLGIPEGFCFTVQMRCKGKPLRGRLSLRLRIILAAMVSHSGKWAGMSMLLTNTMLAVKSLTAEEKYLLHFIESTPHNPRNTQPLVTIRLIGLFPLNDPQECLLTYERICV